MIYITKSDVFLKYFASMRICLNRAYILKTHNDCNNLLTQFTYYMQYVLPIVFYVSTVHINVA